MRVVGAAFPLGREQGLARQTLLVQPVASLPAAQPFARPRIGDIDDRLVVHEILAGVRGLQPRPCIDLVRRSRSCPAGRGDWSEAKTSLICCLHHWEGSVPESEQMTLSTMPCGRVNGVGIAVAHIGHGDLHEL